MCINRMIKRLVGSKAKFLKWHIRGFFFFNGDGPVSYVFVYVCLHRHIRCFLNVVRRIGRREDRS